LVFRVKYHLSIIIKNNASNFGFKCSKTFRRGYNELPDMRDDFQALLPQNIKGMTRSVGC
jgi:hypothetical protein